LNGSAIESRQIMSKIPNVPIAGPKLPGSGFSGKI